MKIDHMSSLKQQLGVTGTGSGNSSQQSQLGLGSHWTPGWVCVGTWGKRETAPLSLELLRAHPRNGSGAQRLAQGPKSLFQNEVFFSQKSIRAPGCLPVVFPQRFQCSFAGVNVRSPQDAPLLLQRHLLGTFWKDGCAPSAAAYSFLSCLIPVCFHCHGTEQLF